MALTARDDPAALREAGRRAAELAWDAIDETPIEIEDPLRSEFAVAALDRLEQLQHEDAPGIMRRILEGTERGAQGLNADPLAEVVQNADDAHALEVRIAVDSARGVLLMAHSGGERVRIDHVLPMSFAFLSTKVRSADTFGKFGVGLKALNKLGSRLEVHCPPYSFVVEGPRVRRIPSRRAIAGMYEPSKFDTLLALQLKPGVDIEGLRNWVGEWGADSMLFLRHVGRIVEIDPAKPKRARTSIELHSIRRLQTRLILRGRDVECHISYLSDRATGQRFRRFVVDVPVPKTVQPPSNKAISTTTAMGLAIDGKRGRFFAGLPLPLTPSLPWSVHAQFDPEPSRKSLEHSEWNDWVLKRLAEFASAVIIDLFKEKAVNAWAAVPLDEELGEQPDSWLQERVRRVFETVHSTVARHVRIQHDGRGLRLTEIAYEQEELTALLSARDAARLSGGATLLPLALRDAGGRWRRVLDELGCSKWLDAEAARQLLSWSDDDLLHRDPRWFAKLTAVLLDEDREATWRDRCLVLADGRRVSPSEIHDAGLLLVRDAALAGLAQRLGSVVGLHPDYLGQDEASRSVRQWLTEANLLVSAPSDRDALGALARLPLDAPKRLNDHELLTLREAVEALPQAENRVELLRDLGRRVAVDASEFTDARAQKCVTPISTAYLPSAFEGKAATWARAAGSVAGLRWIDRRYAQALRLPNERGPAGARDFLISLGAEVAPRLQGLPTSSFNRETVQPFLNFRNPEFQKRAVEDRGHLRFVRNDCKSLALHAVVRDITATAQPSRRRRADALLNTLHDSWDRLYADRSTIRAFDADRTLTPHGRIPATWIADAASVPWMDNELGEPCLPCDLVVRTAEYLSAIGDEPAAFAVGLGQTHVGWPVLEALGIAVRPRAKHLITQLIELQRRDLASPSEENLQHANSVYQVLSSMCPRGPITSDAMVDDIPIGGLRRQFAATGHRPGLVRTVNGWRGPSDVFSGRALFAQRRSFVPASSAAALLWRTLHIDSPTVEACISVLEEIAQDSVGATERAVLADTYRYVSSQIKSGARRPAALQKLPLWTGTKWTTIRPIYAVDDRELAATLSVEIRTAVWQPPAALGPLESFMEGARVTKVSESRVQLTAATRRRAVAHAYLQERFRLATLHLRASLAEEDAKAHDALAVTWDAFHEAGVRLAQPLEVELRLGRSQPVQVARRAQFDIDDLTLYVVEERDLADEKAGGYAVATAFPDADQSSVALRWIAAWRRAERGEEPNVMRLAPRQQEDIHKLLEQMNERAQTPKPPLMPRKRDTRAAQTQEPAVPKLKSPEDLTYGVEFAIVEPDPSGQTVQRRGLRTGKPKGGGTFEPRRPRRNNDDWDPEDIAFEAVRQALWMIDETELEDVSRLRRLGADGLRNDDFIEVKRNRRGLPTSISLDANEFERAQRAQEHFVLVIAYDLDTDLETKVRFYVNPLAVLPKLPQTSVTLGGFRSTRTFEVTFFSPDANEKHPPSDQPGD